MTSQKFQQHRLVDSIARVGIAIDFDNLLAHCELLAQGLESERTRFASFVEKETASLDDDERSYFSEWYSEDAWRLDDVFPALQSTSAFLLSYGIFEKSLNEICRNAKRRVDTDIALSDINGQGIERAKIFLSKVCGVATPFSTPEWQQIMNVSKLRNVMAHAFGELDLANQKHKHVLEYARNEPTIRIKQHEPKLEFAEIELTLEFVASVTKSFRAFLISVCNQTVP